MVSFKQEESNRVRAALKDAGYRVKSITHPYRNSDWILVDILIPQWLKDASTFQYFEDQIWEYERKAYAIVKHASGRDHRQNMVECDYFVENIRVRAVT